MKQEKWDELHKELDDALESGFDTAKVALRRYLLENKEQVAADLEEMRKKSNHTIDTIEEAAANYENKDQHQRSKLDFIAGAKWQQERMYSEEEVGNIANWAFGFYKRNDLSDSELEDEFNRILVEQFKKK